MEFNLEHLQEIIISYAPKVVGALLTLFIGLWVIGALTRFAKRTMERRNVDATVRPFLSTMINIVLKILLLFTVLGMFGVETTSFIAVFGALAFAVGMALQGSLGHFASGILLLLLKPYKVGDYIEIAGEGGTVEKIEIFNTVLRTPDNKILFIPNGQVTSGVITNYTTESERRVDLVFGIGYPDDIDKARSVIKEVIDRCPLALKDPPPQIEVVALADSSVNFNVRPWCKTEDYWDVFYYMQANIKKAFDEVGIGIPYPQMDVHMFEQPTN